MYDFLVDLDEYFCEKYANYDKLCVLPGYKMPVMHTSFVDEFGRTRAYTLPSETMRLALQEKKAELLAELKNRMADPTFSFSFQPMGFFQRISQKFSKFGFTKHLNGILGKHGLSAQEAGEGLDISEEIWTNICKGKFLPTKNLIFSLALTAQFTFEETEMLLLLCNENFDYSFVKDTVIAYLLNNKVYNPGMIDAALQEYKISNLFIK